MKRRNPSLRSALIAVAACLGSAQAAIIVTGLGGPLHQSTGGTIGTAGFDNNHTSRELGMTMNLTFTPQAGDLIGTVLLAEIGGTSNGTGIYLIDGALAVLGKNNTGGAPFPGSLNDTDGQQWAVSHPASITAGTEYSVGVILNGSITQVRIGLATIGLVDVESFSLTNTNIAVSNAWFGNRSLSVGTNDTAVGSRGALAENTEAPEMFRASLARNFEGDIDVSFWNATATGFQPVPEPSAALLAALGGLCLARGRR